MKLTILLLSVSLAFLAGCTTSYKTGQTPDDLYYSPTRAADEYVRSDRDEEPPRYNDDYYEDRYLRMKVRNRNRWSDLDDWYYSEYRNRHQVYLGCCLCPGDWSPHSYWNTYYNPYYQNYVIIKNVKSPVYSKPRTFNLNTYQPSGQVQTSGNPKYNPNSSNSNNSYSPRTNSNTTNGNRLREVFRSSGTSSSSGSNNPGSTNNSTSTGSGSSGSSNSGSSGSTAPVRRF